MKFLGIDYGARRVGLAISDTEGMIAFPHTVVPNNDGLVQTIAEVIRKERVQSVVIGDTRALSGAENPVTREAEEFAKVLSADAGVPVATIWEAWSSVEASRFAPKGREHDDAAAAAVILQRYLDTKQS